MNKTKKRLLITGVSGLLGNNLAFCLKDKYEVMGWYYTHEVLIDGIQNQHVNLICPLSVSEALESFQPDIVIHCAAISDVDLCENNHKLAHQVNVLGTKILVEKLKDSPSKFFYISTDLVYAETEEASLSEKSPVDPPNYYGLTKYQAEEIALSKKGSVVVRTNFFGWNIRHKLSLAEWVFQELSFGKDIQCFTDVLFSSIYTFDFAQLIHEAIEKDIKGVYNFASQTAMSKYDFAIKLADYFQLKTSLIHPIPVDQFHFVAKRRKNLALNVTKLTQSLQQSPPSFEKTIENFYQDSLKGLNEKIKHKNKVYPELNFIPYGRQNVDQDDIQAVVSVLKSTNLAQGPKIQEFENTLSGITKATYTVAVNSGTSALHTACLAAGIGSGDEVLTTSNTFLASANCIVYCLAKPVFADIDLKTYNISPQEINKKITDKTKAIIPVHFAGQSCLMAEIKKIVSSYEKKFGHKIYIIEDGSHALGSKYHEAPVGSCFYSDMTVMSFHPVKHITTGEGGAILTNDQDILKKLKCFRSHGVTSNPEDFIYHEQAYENLKNVAAKKIQRPWYYEQQFLGHNYRITDLQCALGISQLKKLPWYCQRRRTIFNEYQEAFKDLDWLQRPFEAEEFSTNFHLYVPLFDFEKMDISRPEFMQKLKETGIQTQVHYIPVHTQPYYQKNYDTRWGDFPQTEKYYQSCLSLPLFPAMSNADVKKVIHTIKKLGQKKRV